MKYNGNDLDKLIDGYTTINVEGRGLKGQKLNVINVDGVDGTIINGKSLDSSIIKIYFLIESKNHIHKLEILNELNFYLHQANGEVKIEFEDEEGYRLGYLREVNNPPTNDKVGVGYFEMYLARPFRYVEKTLNAVARKNESNAFVNIPTTKALKLEYSDIITLNIKKLSSVGFKNSLGQLIIFDPLSEVDSIWVKRDEIKSTLEETSGQISIVDKLQWQRSTWKTFEIPADGWVAALNAGYIEVHWKELYL